MPAADDPIALLLAGRYPDPETGELLRSESLSIAIEDSLDGMEAELLRSLSLGKRLALIAEREGLTVNQAQVRLRAPQRRFVAALTELLVADGVPRAEVPRAIAELVATEPTIRT